MDGVTVLNTIEVIETTWGFSGLGLFFGFGGLIAFIGLIITPSDNIPFFLLSLIMCSFISVMIFSTATKLPPKLHYQVIIDDSVSMTEFTEKYKIIDIQGKIYTVEALTEQ